jgi:hypothetical protein
MPQGKPKRAAADTTRLKREIRAADSKVRDFANVLAQSTNPRFKALLGGEQKKAMKTANAKSDTLNAIRKGAPTGTHKSFAEGTEGFDGRALTSESAPKPPRVSIPLGHPARDVLPRAIGTPALARRSDGRENLGTETVTKQADDSRAQSSSGRGTRAAVSRFNDRSV